MKQMGPRYTVWILAASALCATVLLAVRHWGTDPGPASIRAAGDSRYSAGDLEGAKKEYRRAIRARSQDPDPKVRDQALAARMRLGYAVARTEGYAAARRVFLEASKAPEGTGAIDSEYGSIRDQAAYQAAVCLAAQGKQAEARTEFRRIIRERPLSPVVFQAFGRIARMGDPNREEEQSIQSAISRQEEWMRFEMSVCGPKAIECLLKRLRLPNRGYREIAKDCGTRDTGTTLDGMRMGLAASGLECEGLMVNRRDFAKLPLPAIWLDGDHYTVLLEVGKAHATIHDTRYASVRRVPLPSEDDAEFLATVLTIRRPEDASTLGNRTP